MSLRIRFIKPRVGSVKYLGFEPKRHQTLAPARLTLSKSQGTLEIHSRA